jgi:NAD dependent epimerase/dehydratase family enzyme
VAGGAQYVPWIHVDDVVGALVHCLESAAARGPINVCAPNPVTNRELSRTLGRVLRRPALIPVPAAALRLAFGEMAEVVTTGVRVVPKRLEELGYEFEHPGLEPALRSLLRR